MSVSVHNLVRNGALCGRRVSSAALFVSVVLSVACGSRADPRPPIYPNPPAITDLVVSQRGAFGILRFSPPALFAEVGEEVEIEAVEVLVYAERYPALTPDMLIAGLERRRDVMVLDARQQAEAEKARAAAQAALAAGTPPPIASKVAAPTVRRRSPDEDLIYRLPPAVHLEWQRQGLAADVILEAAQRLVVAVDALWTTLQLPATILDPQQPPPQLPPAGDIAAASATILDRAVYERPLTVIAFASRAAVSRRVPVEQFADLLIDDMLQVAIPLGTPATGELRTRYFFAVRSSSTRQTPGVLTTVVGMAPDAVPVAPTDLSATVGDTGVTLTWNPPAGDIALRRLPPTSLTYNVYRVTPEEGKLVGATPLNTVPLTVTTYTDSTMRWGQNHVYEVRALAHSGGTLRRESDAARTAGIEVIDRFPPATPTGVNATRAANRVTLQWTPSTSIDLIGYRVYRHPAPAPPVPTTPAPQATEGNAMVDAGWLLLTPEPVPFSRFTDPDADPAVRFVWAVEAIDAAGNISAVALSSEGTDMSRGDTSR